MCCLVLQSNFALLLTIQFALLISSLINIIKSGCHIVQLSRDAKVKMRQRSLRRVFHFRGIATRSHTGRPRTCLVLFMGFSNLSGSLVQPSINSCFHVSPVCIDFKRSSLTSSDADFPVYRMYRLPSSRRSSLKGLMVSSIFADILARS